MPFPWYNTTGRASSYVSLVPDIRELPKNEQRGSLMHRFTFLTILCLLGVGSCLLSAVRAATTPTADDRLTTAQQLLNLHQDQQAAVELQGFLDNYPGDARVGQAALLLGNCWQHLEKYDKAILAYQQAVKKSPDAKGASLRGQAYYYLGDCSFARQELEKAVRYYGYALKLISGDAEPHDTRAVLDG